MDSVLISTPVHWMEEDWSVSSASVTVKGETFQLKFKASDGPLAKGSEPFLAAALLPVMKIGQPLHISGTVSPKLLAATHTIQDIYRKWFPEFRKISIQADSGLSDEANLAGDVGTFFSGGVDSFYTLLKHQGEITKLILIHGFDMRLENTPLRTRVSKELRQVAEAFGKDLVEVETNLTGFSNQYTSFPDHYAGSALATVGLMLSPQFKKIYIPATYSYEHLFPESTHPLLDPLWSMESLIYEHDGCEAGRVEKIARIAESDIALRSLRVCFDDSYNCGTCAKCLYTMVSLQAVGALERCSCFHHKLDVDAVSRMKIWPDRILPFAEESLSALEQNGNNTELAESLRSCIRNHKYRQLSNHLNENLREFLDSTRGATFMSGKRNMMFKSLWLNEKEWLFREVMKEKLKGLDQKFLFGLARRLYNIS
jgi:hypothetical protein